MNLPVIERKRMRDREKYRRRSQTINPKLSCPNCGGQVKYFRKFCTPSCANRYNARALMKERVVKKCLTCQTEIFCLPSDMDQIYCSTPCIPSKKGIGRTKLYIKNCPYCGKQFQGRGKLGLNRKFCNAHCAGQNTQNPNHLWSPKYGNACLMCGENDSPHSVGGKCERCFLRGYSKGYQKENAKRIRDVEFIRLHGVPYDDWMLLKTRKRLLRILRTTVYYQKSIETRKATKAERHQIALSNRKNREHLRRMLVKSTDITGAWLKELKENAVNCLLCGIQMNDNGSIWPNGKHLDHIMPVALGGLHMKCNVRYICAKCNVTRTASLGTILSQGIPPEVIISKFPKNFFQVSIENQIPHPIL